MTPEIERKIWAGIVRELENDYLRGMNLIGKTVCFHVPENQRQALNNNQPTCPAIVTADWNQDGEPSQKRCNLKIMYDGPHTGWATSIAHIDMFPKTDGVETTLVWSLYPEG